MNIWEAEMNEISLTKRELEERILMREKRFGEMLLALQKPMPKLPGTINNKGILTVPVAKIEKYIADEKANAAHAAIHAFLEASFEKLD